MANGMPSANNTGMGELFRRLRFVLIALVIYRIGTHIPVPGIDPAQLSALFDQNQGTILGLANVFSGGALERMSILALGILPYISASIIMQLMTAVTPELDAIKKEGESGRKKISQWTRYLTVALALVQGTGMTVGLANQGLTYDASIGFYVIAITSLVTGAVFMMWLGEQITEKGIGNGISLLIFAGIVAGLPQAIGQSLEQARQGELNILILLGVLTRLTIFGSAYIALVCLLPQFLVVMFNVPFYLGGTSMLIVVVVVMDFMAQVQSHLMSHQYDGVMKKANLSSIGTAGRLR